MVLVERTDGMRLNLTAAQTLMDVPKGIVVEMAGKELFIVRGWTLNELEHECTYRYRGGQPSFFTTIRAEWQGWPIEQLEANETEGD